MPPTKRTVATANGGEDVALTQAEIDAISAEWAAGDAEIANRATVSNLAQRNHALAAVSDLKAENKLLRASLLVALDEINNLRQWTVAMKAAVAGAANLAALKTAVADLDTLNDRTKAQAVTALTNKLNSGVADDAN